MINEEELINLWKNGLTGTEIAKILGTTRSAVLGKMHRIRSKYGIEYRKPTPIPKEEKPVVAKQKKKIGPKPKIAPLPVVPQIQFLFDDEEIERPDDVLTIFELKRSNCRYITTVNGPKGTFYCGKQVDRAAYCKEHADLCYYTIPRRA